MSYYGRYEVYVSSINKPGVSITSTNHYPGDPNFSGSFHDIRVRGTTEEINQKLRKAFDNDDTIMVDLTGELINAIQRLEEY